MLQSATVKTNTKRKLTQNKRKSQNPCKLRARSFLSFLLCARGPTLPGAASFVQTDFAGTESEGKEKETDARVSNREKGGSRLWSWTGWTWAQTSLSKSGPRTDEFTPSWRGGRRNQIRVTCRSRRRHLHPQMNGLGNLQTRKTSHSMNRSSKPVDRKKKWNKIFCYAKAVGFVLTATKRLCYGGSNAVISRLILAKGVRFIEARFSERCTFYRGLRMRTAVSRRRQASSNAKLSINWLSILSIVFPKLSIVSQNYR